MVAATIFPIPDYRMSYGGKMNSQLVGATSDRFQLDKRVVPCRSEGLENSRRFLAALVDSPDSFLLRTTDGEFYDSR